MTNRRTSIYVATVSMDQESVPGWLDSLMHAVEGKDMVAAQPSDDGLRFAWRAANDQVATTLAQSLFPDHPFRLFTGIGIHRREVAAA